MRVKDVFIIYVFVLGGRKILLWKCKLEEDGRLNKAYFF